MLLMIFDEIRKHAANGFYPIAFRRLKHKQLKTKRFTRKLGTWTNEESWQQRAYAEIGLIMKNDFPYRTNDSDGYEQA